MTGHPPGDAAVPVRYRRTQFGTRLALATLLGGALGAWVLVALVSKTTLEAVPWLPYALYGVLALAFLLYGQLTVSVDEREIRVVFGVGLVRKIVDLADVRGAAIGRTRLWWGWGNHWTPAGWLYNVSGRWIVRVDMRMERPVLIGTDDPQGLLDAIEAALAQRGRPAPAASP